jgi:hypothetical protein
MWKDIIFAGLLKSGTPHVRIRKIDDLRVRVLNRTNPIETGVEWESAASPGFARRVASQGSIDSTKDHGPHVIL